MFVFVIAYLRFLMHLSLPIRNLFIAAGLIYVGGAIGLEAIGGRHFDLYGKDAVYQVYTTVEELLEMTGIVVFIYALLEHIRIEFPELTIKIVSGDTKMDAPESQEHPRDHVAN